MRTRSPLLAAAIGAAILAAPLAASAATTENLDRRAFDSTPDRAAGSLHINGATAGPLGGYLDITFTAVDGSLPTAPQVCEPITVDATLTVSPGETLGIATTGEACTGFFGGPAVMNAYFTKEHVTYAGTAHRKAKVVGDGLIGANDMGFLGAQASVMTTVAWK
jgi:hypothetical protein